MKLGRVGRYQPHWHHGTRLAPSTSNVDIAVSSANVASVALVSSGVELVVVALAFGCPCVAGFVCEGSNWRILNGLIRILVGCWLLRPVMNLSYSCVPINCCVYASKDDGSIMLAFQLFACRYQPCLTLVYCYLAWWHWPIRLFSFICLILTIARLCDCSIW